MKTKHEIHKWTFPARFRSGAYSWKASRLASQRLREAVSEIKKVAKKNPVLGAEGTVRLMEKLWPALEHIDTSSGALGFAVNKTLDALIPIIVKAPANEKTRGQWLDRLWQAMADDGVDYLSPVGDRWGEICASVEVAGQWADDLVPTLRSCWSDPNPGRYFHGATAVCPVCWWRVGIRTYSIYWNWSDVRCGITGALVSRRFWPWARKRTPSGMPRPRED